MCEIEIPIKIDEMIADFQCIDTVDQIDVIHPIDDFTPLSDSLKQDLGSI